MLRSSLRSVLPEPVADRLREAGIDPTLRAEDLSADRFLAIAAAIRDAV